MPLTESMENYLEAIFEIKKRKTVVRVRDVAKEIVNIMICIIRLVAVRFITIGQNVILV